VSGRDVSDGPLHVLDEQTLPDYVRVYRIQGPLLFGATDAMLEIADRVGELPSIVILKLRYMTAIDATGLRAVMDLADRLHESGRTMIVCGAQPQPAALMKDADFEQHIGASNVCANTRDALLRAAEIHAAVRSVA
jgi:SulP family sulfate permease